jgi:flagellar biogenesis protein FliO
MDVVAENGRQILSLLVVFSLLGLTVWKLGRGGVPTLGRLQNKAKTLQSLERLPLTPQHTLHVIDLRGRQILVATHPQGVTVLDSAEARALGRSA